jgi:hypothetical protein
MRPAYRYSFVHRVIAALLVVFGILGVIGGFTMRTYEYGSSVVNLGMLFERQTTIVAAFATIGIGLLIELIAEVRGLRPIYPRRR